MTTLKSKRRGAQRFKNFKKATAGMLNEHMKNKGLSLKDATEQDKNEVLEMLFSLPQDVFEELLTMKEQENDNTPTFH